MKKTKIIIGTISLLTPISIVAPLISCANNDQKVLLTFEASTGGSIKGSTTLEVQKGTLWKDVTKPETEHEVGYRFGRWNNDQGEEIDENFVISDALTITAQFDVFNVEITFKDDQSQQEHGHIVGGTTTISVQEGKTWAELTNIPQVELNDSRYYLEGWHDASTEQKMLPTTKLMSNMEINPMFELGKGIRLDFITSEHGSISGTTTLFFDQPVSFGDVDKPQATPDEGYLFAEWRSSDNYSLEDYAFISEPMVVYAMFEKECTINFSAGEHGSLQNPTPITVWKGQRVDFAAFPKAIPSQGYVFEGWFLDGKPFYQESYFDCNIFKESCTVEARFIEETDQPTPQKYFDLMPYEDEEYVEIYGFKGEQSVVRIPSSFVIDGKTYNDIRLTSWSFTDKPNLKEIYIPKEVTSILGLFENCNNLEKIVVANDNPFYKSIHEDQIVIDINEKIVVKSLTDYIPDSEDEVTQIGTSAYSGVTFTNSNLSIPANITNIGGGAFNQCHNLKTLSFEGGSSKQIDLGFNAFCETELEKVTLNVKCNFGPWVFSACPNLRELVVEQLVDGYPFDETTFEGTNNITTVTIGKDVNNVDFLDYIPSSITTLTVEEGNETFTSKNPIGGEELYGVFETLMDPTQLSLVKATKNTILPDNLLEIRRHSFSRVLNLESITIPASVQDIEIESFVGCTDLKHIYVEEGNENYTSKNKKGEECDCLIEKDGDNKNTILLGLDEKGLDDSIALIQDSAFANNLGLTSLVLPSSIEGIGMSAFEGCKNLESVDLSACNQLTFLSMYLFDSCYSLSEILLPESLEGIEERAFQNCGNLTELIIPDNVTYFDDTALNGVNNLTTIRLGADISNIDFIARTYSNIKTIRVNSGNTWFTSKDKQGNECNCIMDSDRVRLYFATGSSTILDSIKTTSSHLFTNRTLPKDYTIPQKAETIEVIEDSLLNSTKGIENLTIGEGVTTFENGGNAVISSCINLKTVHFPSTLYAISSSVIGDCPNLVQVDIANCPFETATTYFIYECLNLPSITFPSSVKTFEEDCLYNCISLNDITINATDINEITLADYPVFTNLANHGTLHVHSQAIGNLFKLNSPDLADWTIDVI